MLTLKRSFIFRDMLVDIPSCQAERQISYRWIRRPKRYVAAQQADRRDRRTTTAATAVQLMLQMSEKRKKETAVLLVYVRVPLKMSQRLKKTAVLLFVREYSSSSDAEKKKIENATTFNSPPQGYRQELLLLSISICCHPSFPPTRQNTNYATVLLWIVRVAY